MDIHLPRIDRLIATIRQESASGRFFITYKDLKRTVTKEVIVAVVSTFNHPVHRRSMVVERILEKGLIVFSILASMREEHQIFAFIEHDELDSRLPMEKEQVLRITSTVGDRFWREVQWEFLPYEFQKNDHHRCIRDQVILPFLKETTKAEGAFGEIYETVIASAQQTLLPEQVSL